MFKALSDNYQVFVAALTIKMCVYFIIIANVCISNAIGNKKSIDNLIIIIIIITNKWTTSSY